MGDGVKNCNSSFSHNEKFHDEFLSDRSLDLYKETNRDLMNIEDSPLSRNNIEENENIVWILTDRVNGMRLLYSAVEQLMSDYRLIAKSCFCFTKHFVSSKKKKKKKKKKS